MKILILEDNTTDADLCKRAIDNAIDHCTIDLARTIAEAKKLIRTDTCYDVALLDINLPDGNGLELLSEIREKELDTAVVIFTDQGNEELAVSALKAGADDYIPKKQGFIAELPHVINLAILNFRQNQKQQTEIIKVIYIEHNPVDVDLTLRHLKKYAPNVRIDIISTAENALKLLPIAAGEKYNDPYHLMLLDYGLPGMSAFDFIKIIRQERMIQLPIIIITGQGDEEIAVQALKLGANNYITKNENYLFKLPLLIKNAFQITEQKKMTVELLEALKKAQESDRLKSAFLANMSHEIRTPMNGILGFAELLKEPGLSGQEQQVYIRVIEKSGARMLNIINDIVDISKIEAGLMKIYWQETNINEQIEFVYDFFKPEVEEKGIKLSFSNSLPNEEAVIHSDPEKLYSILSNLIKNAVKFTHTGTIEFGYVIREGFLEFFVKDSGVGIPKDRQKAIFERFIQADIEDKNAYQGAGLGLSISKAFIEMLGGKIWVESTDGKGSSFYFTLPYNTEIHLENNFNNDSSSPVEIEPKYQLKILIAEDDEASEMLVSMAVQKFAKEIILARTGLEAVEACQNHQDIDLVLMDIMLPEMDGYEATRQIRKFNNQVVIIAQTACALEGDKEKALAAGCTDYITKPTKTVELQQMIVKYFK